MAASTTRSLMLRWLPFAVVVEVITAVSLSSWVTQWWAAQSSPGSSGLPGAADSVLRARTSSSNADVHTVLWFVAALALVWAMRSYGLARLVAASVALWVYTVAVEVTQRWVPTRTAQWIDVVGNGLGIFAGVAVGVAIRSLWPWGESGALAVDSPRRAE